MGWFDRLLEEVADREPESLAFDARWGTETNWFDLGNYEPTPVRLVGAILDRLVDTLGAEAVAETTLVDLGSGKGRVALLASTRGFRAVVGIEHRKRLHAAAGRNLRRFTDQGGLGCPVDLRLGDVATSPVPAGPLVVWLFNPFGAAVLRQVLGRLADRPAGEVHLVYVVPTELPLVVSRGYRPLVDTGEGDLRWLILVNG